MFSTTRVFFIVLIATTAPVSFAACGPGSGAQILRPVLACTTNDYGYTKCGYLREGLEVTVEEFVPFQVKTPYSIQNYAYEGTMVKTADRHGVRHYVLKKIDLNACGPRYYLDGTCKPILSCEKK